MPPNCCIGLCVYNNEKGLPYVLNNIDILRESNIFNEIHVIAFYDVSKDTSLSILREYQRLHPESMIINENSNPLLVSRVNSRVKRIANARNSILNIIRDRFSHYEYFAMMDSNDYSCVGKIRPDVLREMLNRKEEWDAISFDREDGYYDLWALSYHPYIYSFFHFPKSQDAVKKLKSDFTGRMQHHRKIAPNALIPVYSAFNGFGLYKTDVFLESHYSSLIDLSLFPKGSIGNHAKLIGQRIVNVFEGDCEHRSFHLRAIQRKGARIRISLLSLFVGKPTVHKSTS